MSKEDRLRWLDDHREDLEKHISWVGTPIFSYAFGNARSYREIVLDIAEQIGVSTGAGADTPKVEAAIVQKLWTDTLNRMTAEQREALISQVKSIALTLNPSAKKEAIGFASLAVWSSSHWKAGACQYTAL